ncbi:hypothetical protein QYM36_014274 [Artemia franciscana]|uniref:MARVEL domain-containing protein n=1 Tax=Artemia franciscana TaxID=6661 RepID=A0AA88HGQ3_ARTSF|nr:hypothetical protein QYM36_014274 [Artemia franciscana]
MGDAGVTQIPKANQPHLTTVTIKNDPTIQPAGPVVVLNVNYISSWHGLLKGLQLLFAIICMACASPATHPGTSWFLCVVVITFIFTLLWLSFHFPVHGNTFSCTKCELVKGGKYILKFLLVCSRYLLCYVTLMSRNRKWSIVVQI